MRRWLVVAARLAAMAVLVPALPSSQAAEQEEPTADAEQVLVLSTQLKETQNRLRAYEADNAALRRQNELITQSQATLTQSLAEANAEAELFRRQFADLKLRMEALGLASVGDQKEALEQRLLKSVRDLALLNQQKTTLADHLAALSEAIFRYLKTAPGAGDPATRLDVEAELRASSEALGGPSTRAVNNPEALAANLQNALVVSVKEEWSLVVANVGAKHGVKIGMPFKVVRGDTLIGRVRAIDVRESITGTAIESLSAKDAVIKVGDQLRVETQY
ncbi:MAG: hypothetical protein JO117_00430 [Verrucomicrobia bacterium]|nr:hypothetical protein [Verrucomicrobiota bacterium]MBV9658696.1 hypothetical protein [Verrucomicrobiota bacterium]